MKRNLNNMKKPESCKPLSSIGIEYLNVLLYRLVRQKEYSKRHAPDQIQYWRSQELIVRKCIKLAQYFADGL